MNEYQKRVALCIDEKLIEYAMTEAKSLYNIDILYHHYVVDTQRIYAIPEEHYSKILAIAYRRTIKEMDK